MKKRKYNAGWHTFICKIQKRINRRRQRENDWVGIDVHANINNRERMRLRVFDLVDKRAKTYLGKKGWCDND